MRQDILKFVRLCCRLYKLEAIYIPGKDVYSLRFRGRGVHNFNSKNFYELPQRHRLVLVGRILRVGLNHNVGEKSMMNQVFINRSFGKKITI